MIEQRMKKGVKARPYDIKQVMDKFKPKVVEIHASSDDLKEEIDGKYDAQIAIHLPEYDGTELLDLSSFDETKRLRSVKFIQRSIEQSKKWAKHFNGTPKIIVHPGGWSSEPMKHYEKGFLYDMFQKSFKELNRIGISFMVENMPPFPWFYGGTWHCNIFVDPKETRDFCIGNGYGFCLDICHAYLYCNHIKEINIMQFLQIVRPIIGHIHLSDAKGIDGEGLGIGDGDMPLKDIIQYIAPIQVGVVLEIWNGHKDEYAGFKTGWDKVDGLLFDIDNSPNNGKK